MKKKTAKNKKQLNAERFPHFRRYKKSGYPALITSEYSEKEYNYRKVMHNERD